MRREEKRRRLHEAILNTLYPPAPQPEQVEEDAEENPESKCVESCDVDRIPDDYGLRESSSSASSEDDCDDGGGGGGECDKFRKLSRAQRKRLRKKKLKEDVSRRRNIIGPLLPPSAHDRDDPPGVRQNANGTPGAATNNSNNLREEPGGSKQRGKLKHRRRTKRLAREKLTKN